MLRNEFRRRAQRQEAVLNWYVSMLGISSIVFMAVPMLLAFLGIYDVRESLFYSSRSSVYTDSPSPISRLVGVGDGGPEAERDRALARQTGDRYKLGGEAWRLARGVQDGLTVLDRTCHESWAQRAVVGKKSDTIQAIQHLIPIRYAKDEPSFLWAVIPNRRMINWLGQHEKHVRAFANRIMAQECRRKGKPLVVDVGANSGYYGLVALAHGCRALFVEPQPYCSMLIETSLTANGWSQNRSLAHIWSVAASDQHQEQGLKVWCDTPCYGTVGAPGVGRPTSEMQGPHTQSGPTDLHGWRPSVPLSVHPWLSSPKGQQHRIALLKVDVEGEEAKVLNGLRPLFARRAVRAATVEVSPQFYRQRKQDAKLRNQIYQEIAYIYDQGYQAWAPIGDTQSRKDGRGHRYQRLHTKQQLADYLLRKPFAQHDLFLHQVTEKDTTLSWISNDIVVSPL